MWGGDSLAKARSASVAATACAVLGVALAAAGCGSTAPPGPYNAVSSYLNQIAEGSYAGACGLLDTRARVSLTRTRGQHISCPTVFARCLPSKVTNLKHDQSQLLYATILVTTHRKTADATVSGTAVARAIKHVSLAKERGTWKLTSYGQALKTCSRARRLRAGRHSPRAAVGS